MTVYRCRVCETYVQWLTAKTGRRQFEHYPRESNTVPLGDAWVPQTVRYANRPTRIVMTPLSHYSGAAQAVIKRVFVIHNQERCAVALRNRRLNDQGAGRHRAATRSSSGS